MATITVGVVREQSPGERRVALVPESASRLAPSGIHVLVEAGAGTGAWFSDTAYTAAGADIVSAAELHAHADAVLCVAPPGGDSTAMLRTGQFLVGLLDPLLHPGLVQGWARQGVTAVSLDLLPRTLSRAQSMDALTSQANIAGYKAALLAADAYPRYFPMLTTAAGTSRPAAVLVLGTGVAGLQAIATARRLGAVVTGYDVRPESQEEVESLGGRFLELPSAGSGTGTDGYARALDAAAQRAQQEALDAYISHSDVVITTARVPGHRPPVLVTAQALGRMAAGSVVVDLAAGALGGNVELSQPERTVVLDNGVTLIGAASLPSAMATAASDAYARNIGALLAHLVRDGRLAVDLSDRIQAGVVVTHGGSVVNPAVAALTDSRSPVGGAP